MTTEATPVAMELAGRVVLANAGGGPEAAAAVIATALADMQRRVDILTQERDGARKAMDLFMSAPGMPPHVLQWVQFQMSRQALSTKP